MTEKRVEFLEKYFRSIAGEDGLIEMQELKKWILGPFANFGTITFGTGVNVGSVNIADQMYHQSINDMEKNCGDGDGKVLILTLIFMAFDQLDVSRLICQYTLR